MHIEFLLEEPSAEAALGNLLKTLVPESTSFRLHPFNGKRDLLKKLPDRLRAYKKWLPDDGRIVVLVDEDRQDCRQLKARLEEAAWGAGFATKGTPQRDKFQVLNRIAVEELEAWFLGDEQALLTAYPKVSRSLLRFRGWRDPDAIPGGTAEALERVLKRAGYYRAGMPKTEVARSISQHMDPARNTSHSFGVFVSGIKAILA